MNHTAEHLSVLYRDREGNVQLRTMHSDAIKSSVIKNKSMQTALSRVMVIRHVQKGSTEAVEWAEQWGETQSEGRRHIIV